jgi:LVIVD repeat
MTSRPRARRLVAAVTTAIALVASTLALPMTVAGHHNHDHTLAHALHNSPGNPIALPMGENVRYVGGDNTSTGGHVVVQGKRLYVGAYGLGMRIFDISEPDEPRLIGQYLPGVRADAVPDAAVWDGRHIATLNGTRRVTATELRTDKTEFLDVTDPANPRVLWTFVGAADGEAHNGDIADARRTWIASGGVGVNGLRIYDLNPLLGATPAAPTNLFRGDPRALWETSPYRAGRPVGPAFTHTHDVEIYLERPVRQANGLLAPRDILLLVEGGDYLNNNGDTGSMFVIDITDPRAPVVLNRWLHATGPDHHPIRYYHEVQFLDGDPNVVLVTDEDLHNGCGGAGGITALRVSDDLTRVDSELSEWFVPAGTPAPVCSVHVFSSEGALVFLGSYNAGLQVVDYSDPTAPQQAGYFINPGTTAWGALDVGNYIYVGDMTRGLDVYELDDPELLTKLKLQKLLR